MYLRGGAKVEQRRRKKSREKQYVSRQVLGQIQIALPMIGEVKKDDLYGIPISCVMFSPALTWQELLLPITVDACKVSAFTDLVSVSAI